MTSAAAVARVREYCLLLAALCFAALAGRLMLAAIDVVAAERLAAARVDADKPALLELADDLVGVAEAAPAAPPPGVQSLPEAESVRLTLSVTVGPERSEVFVNGRRLGFSPYLGDYTCRPGEPLRIDVVPVREPLIVRHAHCGGRNVLIRD